MIKFLDLQKINSRFQKDFEEKLISIQQSGKYILGDEVDGFEFNFAKYCGTKYCITTGSGLDALTLILKSYMVLGKLKKGDEVIVPANTFIATILSVLQADLIPVLVEPSLESYNITASEIKKYISAKTKAIVVVHLYGQLAEIEAINTLAKLNNVLVIEDAAQAHGAENSSQKKAGSLADAAAFSFYPSKNLGALGDGGAVTTSDETLYNIIKQLRNYGSTEKYKHKYLGINSRLDELQAAFLNIKLKKLDEDNAKRRLIAKSYFSDICNGKIILPSLKASKSSSFYVFTVRVENRADFMSYLKQCNIETHIHYPVPPHSQECLTMFNQQLLPITETIHNTIVSLPISPVMTIKEVEKVIDVVNTY